MYIWLHDSMWPTDTVVPCKMRFWCYILKFILFADSLLEERHLEVQSQILSYFIKHDLITIDQFAFLKNHSTTGCLHRIIDDWYEALNEGEFVMACFFYIKKCFDSINHAILLQKLALYDIRGPELQWFQNNLSGRWQSVSCNGTNSCICNISTGVPQGSTLGPFLFLIFINDLPQHIRTGSSNIFADDSAIYTTGKSFMETKCALQSSVYDAGRWFENNNLPINITKTKCMLIATEGNLNRVALEERPLSLELNGITLEQVPNTPYPGLQLDDKLRWEAHVQKLCRNVSSKLAVLNRLRKVLNKTLLHKQYISCIQPCIDYAVSVWGSCSEQTKYLICRPQRRAARIIAGNFDFINTRGADLMKDLGWQTLDIRRDYFLSTLMYKCIKGNAPVRLTNELIMTADTHDCITRASTRGVLQVPKPSSELFRNSFRYKGTTLWNSLPSHIKDAPDVDRFKCLYKKWFFKWSHVRDSKCIHVCLETCYRTHLFGLLSLIHFKSSTMIYEFYFIGHLVLKYI